MGTGGSVSHKCLIVARIVHGGMRAPLEVRGQALAGACIGLLLTGRGSGLAKSHDFGYSAA